MWCAKQFPIWNTQETTSSYEWTNDLKYLIVYNAGHMDSGHEEMKNCPLEIKYNLLKILS